jgi:hypothetical protein
LNQRLHSLEYGRLLTIQIHFNVIDLEGDGAVQ